MTDAAGAWAHQNAIDFYARNRRETSDLYPSEQVFLPRVLLPGSRILDVGCATGGFFNIMQSLQPDIDYTGIDISERAIESAQQQYPNARFLTTDGNTIPFDDGSFDLVHSAGMLVVEPRYHDVLGEMYRVTNRFLLVDLRLLKDAGEPLDPEVSHYRIEFNGEFDGATVPYVVVDADEAVNFILSLRPRPKALSATGYFHAVSPHTRTKHQEVCVSVFLIEKGGPETASTELHLNDLPLEFSLTSA